MKFWGIIGICCCCFAQEKGYWLPNNDDFIGKIYRIESFSSQYVASRTVDVWLPSDYDKTKKYEVLYMQDGQMLFNAKTTWNQQEWGVDEKVSELLQKKEISPIIVVAVWNIPSIRALNYFPQKAFSLLSSKDKKRVLEKAISTGLDFDKISSDSYLQFLVKELKPYIDQQFSVYTTPDKTGIMGSSMGGLLSMYAFCEYPEVFGKAACLSTHWIGLKDFDNNPIPDAFLKYLDRKLPNSKTHKIYFDYGTETLDSQYLAYQNQVDTILEAHAKQLLNYTNLKFEGADHTENAWKSRLEIPLLFLFKK